MSTPETGKGFIRSVLLLILLAAALPFFILTLESFR